MNDLGYTALPGGRKLSKSDPLICALGALDELNAALGLLRAALAEHPDARIEDLQRDVLAIGGELAAGTPGLDPETVAALQRETTRLSSALPPATGFVLPGTNEPSARAHWARAVCRRAERGLVLVHEQHPGHVSDAALVYLNRLSSFLFAFARALEARS